MWSDWILTVSKSMRNKICFIKLQCKKGQSEMTEYEGSSRWELLQSVNNLPSRELYKLTLVPKMDDDKRWNEHLFGILEN